MEQGYSITINGETHNQKEWCKMYKVSPCTVRNRMEIYGISFEEALKFPRKRSGRTPRPKKVKPVQKRAGYIAKKSDKCRRCHWSEKAEGHWACMYMDLNPLHQRRPCPAGDDCTVWKRKDKRITDAQKEFFKAYIYGGKHV